MTLVYYKVVNELTFHLLRLNDVTWVNPIVFKHDWMMLRQFESPRQLTQICHAISLLGFDNTDDFGWFLIDCWNLISFLEIFNSFECFIIHKNCIVSCEASTTTLDIIVNFSKLLSWLDDLGLGLLRYQSGFWGWQRVVDIVDRVSNFIEKISSEMRNCRVSEIVLRLLVQSSH